MAATDLVYNTVDPVLFTPDYSFLRYTLDKSQSRYDQGLDAVSKSYNNLKRNLTDPANIETRDKFLKDAQDQLQKIASSDLSLPQNIASANNVFDPLATNPAFLYDAYQTERINKNLTEMKGWSESDDMDTRKKFNPKIYNWVASQLDILKNGKGDVNNYKNMPNRSAFAYVDAQDLINKALKDSGGSFSKDINGGVYVYGVENGVSFKKNYDEFARSVLNNNSVYKQQNAILGESDYESLLKQGRESGKNDQQVLSDFANSNYTSIKTSSSDYINSIRTNLEEQRKDLIAQNQSGKLTDQEFLTKQKELQDNISQYSQLKSNYENQFGADDKSAEEKKKIYLNSFLSDPKGFLSNQYFNNDINTFSNIRSSFEKSTIKPNTAYFETLTAVNNSQKTQNDILKGIQTNEIKQEGQDLKEKHEDWLEAGKPVSGKSFGTSEATTENVTTINPDGSISTSKKAKKPELTYVGPSATDITKKLATLNAIGTQIQLKTAKSIDMLASAENGGAISFLNTFGVQRENVQTVRDFFIKQQEAIIKDPSKPYKPNGDESKALNDVYTSLFSFAKLNGEDAVLQKLRENYGKKPEDIDFHGLLDLAISQTKFKDGKELGYANQWEEHKKANLDINYLSNILQTGKNAVISYVNSAPEVKEEFKDVVIQKDGEKPKLIDADEIAKRIKANKNSWYESVDWAIDPQIKLSNEDIKNISEGYINGTVRVQRKYEHLGGNDNIGDIFKDDPGVYVKYNGKEIYLPYGFDVFPMNTEDLQKKFEKINSKIDLPQISDEFKDELLAAPIWNVSGGLKEAIITPLSAGSTQYSSNIMESADGNNFKQIESAADQKTMRKAMMTPKNIAENGVNIHSRSNANGGGLAVSVTFAEADTKEEKKDCVYCGKTVYFPINVGQGTPDILKAYNTINDETEYNRIKNSGKVYDMYNFDAMGIKVQILPHTKGSASGDVIITYQKQDPVTKQFIPDQFETVQDSYTTNNQPYDEIKSEVYNKVVSPFILNRINLEKQAATTAGGNTIDRNQLLKGLVIPQ
jgi:hypothetical protein